MAYVDGFVMAIKAGRLDDYKKMAEEAAVIWKEYGAITTVEAVADDVPYGELTSFPRAVQIEKDSDEVVVFSWIVYPSKEVRDSCNAKVMADPRMNMDMETMPFDGKRMIFGGFIPFIGL
jgi:uncharacterized protein YbaA (DUF1428 family)